MAKMTTSVSKVEAGLASEPKLSEKQWVEAVERKMDGAAGLFDRFYDTLGGAVTSLSRSLDTSLVQLRDVSEQVRGREGGGGHR